jgi:GNAT superfamily N-acetyltransferase
MTRLKLRYLTESDLPFADSLREIAGWNQTLADWQRFLALSPRGCLIAESEHRPVATAVTVAYGNDLGWIGMMLVHPDFRRRGIARVLLQHCIEMLQSAHVKSIKLDATPAGREVYLKMGFKDEYTLTRYQTDSINSSQPLHYIRPARSDDFQQMVSLDHAATGAQRENLLRRLIDESSRAVIYEQNGHITGFGILRRGSLASYLGPIVADPSHAPSIASALANGKTFCDLPDHIPAASAWAKANNFAPQRTLTRMYLGQNVQPSAPNTYFAIAAPDLG